MKKRLIISISIMSLGTSALIGSGSYALLSASTTNGPNDFSGFSAQTIQINSVSGTTSSFQTHTLRANYYTQQISFPMFYDHTDFPSGQNPYDFKTSYSPSGEIQGGWAPGDQVTRSWNIQNKGTGSKITEITAQLDSLKDQNGNSISIGSQVYQDFLGHMNIEVYSPPGSTTPVYTGSFQKLVNGAEPLDKVICLSKGSFSTVSFVASLDLNAGNDLQGVNGVLNFSLGAEQTQNNCFDPPFSNEDYSMKIGSTTPIKFETYDSNGNLLSNSDQNVSLVITGPDQGGGTLKLTYNLGNNGLSCNGGHFQAQVYGDPSKFIQGATYTATVFIGSQMCCQKTFSTEPGNRSNA